MTRRAMGRRAIRHWEEEDAYTVWRKLYKYTQRAGVVKAIKKRTHRRERLEGVRQLRNEVNCRCIRTWENQKENDNGR